MKKIFSIIVSLAPIALFAFLYLENKNSVVRWNIIGIEYFCILIIIYIRTFIISKRYKNIMLHFKQKHYDIIINNYRVSGRIHTIINDSSNIIIALSYWNMNDDETFFRIMNQVNCKKLLPIKEFYYCVFYYIKNDINEEKKHYEEFLNLISDKVECYNTYDLAIRSLLNGIAFDITIISDSCLYLSNDIRTLKELLRKKK